MTPVVMALLHIPYEFGHRYPREFATHPLLVAAMYGNMPCVKLWLATKAYVRPVAGVAFLS